MTTLPISDGQRIVRIRRSDAEDVAVGSSVVLSPLGRTYCVAELFVNEGGRCMAALNEGDAFALVAPADRLTVVHTSPLERLRASGGLGGPALIVFVLLAVLVAGWWALS